jgi:hypothetical protein
MCRQRGTTRDDADPNALNADDLTGRNRLWLQADDTTEQRAILSCLHGPYTTFYGGSDFEEGQWVTFLPSAG